MGKIDGMARTMWTQTSIQPIRSIRINYTHRNYFTQKLGVLFYHPNIVSSKMCINGLKLCKFTVKSREKPRSKHPFPTDTPSHNAFPAYLHARYHFTVRRSPSRKSTRGV